MHTATTKRITATGDEHDQQAQLLMHDQSDIDNEFNESLNEEWQPDDYDRQGEDDEEEELVNSEPEADQMPLMVGTTAKAITRVLPHSLY